MLFACYQLKVVCKSEILFLDTYAQHTHTHTHTHTYTHTYTHTHTHTHKHTHTVQGCTLQPVQVVHICAGGHLHSLPQSRLDSSSGTGHLYLTHPRPPNIPCAVGHHRLCGRLLCSTRPNASVVSEYGRVGERKEFLVRVCEYV